MLKDSLKTILKATGLRCLRENSLPKCLDLAADLKSLQGLAEIRQIIDVGANIGQSTASYLKAFPAAGIIACEPSPAAFAALCRQFETNSRVTLKNLALGSYDGEALLRVLASTSELNYIIKNPESHAAEAAEPSCVSVTMATLDTLIKQLPRATPIDLLKIDTEGHDMDVLLGAENSIAQGQVRAIFIECCFDRDDRQHSYFPDIFSWLDNRGFAFMGLYDVHHRPCKLHYCNALFIHSR